MSGVTTEINSSRIDLNISLINRGLLSINGDDYEGSKIEIYDLSGKILYADIISQSFVKFKRDLLPGIYIVKIINNINLYIWKT